ncbi:MAG TPA: FAD-dependent monooxygenase [Acidobacteriaceae bacterium]|nr:FAD-dependent monooxygenase [Acidobacteriaceae bacterium]
MYDTDVFICGGGPAGLAAAIAARQQGFAVIVADCFKPPIDKACGEGLMPDSLAALEALGITLDNCETGTFHGIRFVDKEQSVEAYFPQGVGRGIRRMLLHDFLHQHAARLGVQFHWATQVLGVQEHVVQAGQKQIRSRWIVGADGMHSRIRKWANLESGKRLSRRIGIRQHFKVSPWSRFMEIHWSSRGQAYVTPISEQEVCVVLMSRECFSSITDVFPLFPELALRLCKAERSSSERGSLTAGRTYDRVCNDHTALIGDASGSVDAIVGEGLALSFLQARALSAALKQGDLTLYERAHRQIRRVPTFMSQSMLLMDRFDMLRRKTLSSLHHNPQLFAQMLSVHVGVAPLTVWGRAGILNVGFQLLV